MVAPIALIPSTPIRIVAIGGNIHEVRRLSTGALLGLIREAAPGHWRTDRRQFASAGAAADHVVREQALA